MKPKGTLWIAAFAALVVPMRVAHPKVEPTPP